MAGASADLGGAPPATLRSRLLVFSAKTWQDLADFSPTVPALPRRLDSWL